MQLPGAETSVSTGQDGRDRQVGHDGRDGQVSVSTGRDGQLRRDGRASEEHTEDRGVIEETEEFLTDFIVLPEFTPTIISAWIAAAWLCDAWDRFPHLSIYSPEKRCGKTRLLEVLNLIVPSPLSTSSISPAALYRFIGGAKRRPTIILDEAQSLSRARSESGEVIRELLNAGIEKHAKVIRCGGKKMTEVIEFPTYSPKVFAQIGEPEGVLADRSLPIRMRRKTKEDIVQRLRLREVEPRARALRKRLEQWAEESEKDARDVYSWIDPLEIENDRMADLLMPLQTVLVLEGGDQEDILTMYAATLDERDQKQESQSWGVRLLRACREIFHEVKSSFIPTATLIEKLKAREEEPWYRWNKGEGITPESLAKLLRPYDVNPQHNKTRTQRGYHASDFGEAWTRYLPYLSPETPSKPSNPSSPSKGRAQR